MSRELTQVADTKFELCHHVEQVLKIGRDFQKQDIWRGAHHDTAKLLCDTIEYLRDRLNTPIGNAAAMYTALKEMQARLVAGVQDGTMDCYEALEIVEKAISEPSRNCDVGTAEEQEERFDAFCKSHVRMCKECPIRPAYGHYCHLAWGQMPYRAEEGAGK